MVGAFLAGVYEAGLNPEGWTDVVRCISDKFGGAKVALFHLDRASFGIEGWARDLDPKTWTTAPASVYHDPRFNPSLRIALEVPVGSLMDRRNFIDDAGFDRHPLEYNFFGPNRMFHLISSTVQRDPGSASFFFVSRQREAEPFHSDELSMATALVDHLGRSMRTYRALRLVEARNLAFDRALDRLAVGVVLADAGLRVLHANVAAGRMLEGGDGIAQRLGRISLTDPRAQRQLEAAAYRASHPAPGMADAEFAAPRRILSPLRICVFPSFGEATALSPRAQVLIIIRASGQQRDATQSLEGLAADFHLTDSEMRVAVLAAAAESTQQIAAALGLSENTVKTHLKAIYAKTGTATRAGFVRLFLARVPY